MLIFFHRFRNDGSQKTQRPRARLRDVARVAASASGDPAMAFEFEMAAILPMVRASRPSCPAAGLLLSVFTRASHAPRDRTV
jgi:hypothetical protein